MNNSKRISSNCENIYNPNLDIWGLPQEYRGIKFHPIKLIDSESLTDLSLLFGQCKTKINDIEIMKINYLKFLICVIARSTEEINITKKMYDFLKKITGYDIEILSIVYPNVEKVEKFKDFYLKIVFKDVDINGKIQNVEITESEFDIIREIVLLQNGLSLGYIEEYDSKLEEDLNFVNRDFSGLTLEEQLFSFCCLMNCPITMFKDYTWYQFKQHFARAGIFIDYLIFKPLESSGQVEFKKSKLSHWLEHVGYKGRYDSILVEKEQYVQDSDIFKASQQK